MTRASEFPPPIQFKFILLAPSELLGPWRTRSSQSSRNHKGKDKDKTSPSRRAARNASSGCSPSIVTEEGASHVCNRCVRSTEVARAGAGACRVFKPATHNALLDILLARGVNGESPSKRRRSRKSIVPIRREEASPTVQRRKSLKGRAEEREVEEMGEDADVKEKGKGQAAGRRKSVAPKRRKSVAPKAKKVVVEEGEDGQPVAGNVYFVDYMRVYMTVYFRSFPYYEDIHKDDEAQERRYRNRRRYTLCHDTPTFLSHLRRRATQENPQTRTIKDIQGHEESTTA